MVSDEPLPDRCAANITKRVGLRIEDKERAVAFDSDDIEQVHLQKGCVQFEKPPEYGEVISYLNHGFDVTGVDLTDPEADEDATTTVEIEDDDPEVMHETTEHRGFCERYPMGDSDKCYNHGAAGGAPEGNVNGMTHGLKTMRSNYYNHLSDEEKYAIEQLADSWIENAPFDRDHFGKVNEVKRIAVDQFRLWKAQDEFVDTDAGEESGLLEEITIDFDPESGEITADDENPANLAYDRLDRTTIRKLKELGCLDDPESQQADATKSLAQKFKDLEED